MKWFQATAYGWDVYVFVFANRRTFRRSYMNYVKHVRPGLCRAIAACATYKKGVRRVDLYFSKEDLKYEGIAHECYHAVEQMARERRRTHKRCGEEWRATCHGEMVDFILLRMSRAGLQVRHSSTDWT